MTTADFCYNFYLKIIALKIIAFCQWYDISIIQINFNIFSGPNVYISDHKFRYNMVILIMQPVFFFFFFFFFFLHF